MRKGRTMKIDNDTAGGPATSIHAGVRKTRRAYTRFCRPATAGTCSRGASGDLPRGDWRALERLDSRWAMEACGDLTGCAVCEANKTPTRSFLERLFSGHEPMPLALDPHGARPNNGAEAAGTRWVDVTPISRDGLVREGLVCDDGLHPSAKQYGEWVEAALPEIRAALGSAVAGDPKPSGSTTSR